MLELKVLEDNLVENIIDEALSLLQDTGVEVQCDALMERMESAGLNVDKILTALHSQNVLLRKVSNLFHRLLIYMIVVVTQGWKFNVMHLWNGWNQLV